DGDLGLAHPDGLDEDDVVPGRLEDRQRLTRGARDAAEAAGTGRGTDVRVRVGRQSDHAGLVAQDRAAGADAGRIDREHADPVTATGEVDAERLDEGGLADPWDTRDADPNRSSDLRVRRRRQLGE